jgi:hypothetical protein
MVELGQDMKMYILNEIPDVRKMLQMTVAFGMLIEPHFDLAEPPQHYALKDLSKDRMLLFDIAIINQNLNPSPF